jgi:hypothetical protein
MAAGAFWPETRGFPSGDFEHPGEYVAYIDRCLLENRIRRLSREVIAHSSDLSVVKAAFSHFDSENRAS